MNIVNENKHGWKKSVIIRNIKNKIDEWLNTIDDEMLVKDIKSSYIVTGGAIASMLCGDSPNDYDIYFDNIDVATRVARHYVSKLTIEAQSFIQINNTENRVEVKVKSAGVIRGEDDKLNDYAFFELSDNDLNNRNISMSEAYISIKYDKKEKYAVSMITSNSISLSNDIQIVTRFIGNASEIHNNFDFVHCTNYYSEKEGLVLNQPALEAIISRSLVYVGSLYPICSIFRIRKFIERGWSITAGQILKIVWDINSLKLDQVGVLQEQLTGVDVAYLNELISIIKKENPKNIDRAYICNLIDQVFSDTE